MSYLNGILDLPWWGYVLITLVFVQTTIAAVTLYLHRCQAHLSVKMHPAPAHFFRFWLWLATGMSTLEWVAIHRKHHAKCETEDDPHSPRIYGIRKVMFQGTELYKTAADDAETLQRYGHGTPDDWLENNLYRGRFPIGITLMFAIDFALFGVIGITIWAVQMIWIPLHGAGGINGVGHYWGYRNYETADDSTNIYPWAFWVGGEELHNNHHSYPSSARFSLKPWEFDIGWLYIRVLEFLHLAKVKKVAPHPVLDKTKQAVDMETVKAVIRSKMHVMADYANKVTWPVWKEEFSKAELWHKKVLKKARKGLVLDRSRINAQLNQWLEEALNNFSRVRITYQYRLRLQEVWEQRYSSQEKLLQALRDWCQKAEQSGIKALQDFADSLRGYTLQPV
jgi:stearoyl-CoA desaturase (delta-9 desaturase)